MHTCDYVRMWYIHTDSDYAVHYALGMPRYKNFYVILCHGELCLDMSHVTT